MSTCGDLLATNEPYMGNMVGYLADWRGIGNVKAGTHSKQNAQKFLSELGSLVLSTFVDLVHSLIEG